MMIQRSLGRVGGWFLLAAAGAALAQSAPTPASESGGKPVLSVSITQPKGLALTRTLEASGSITAWQEAVVSAEANGLQIEQVLVDVGDAVTKGQVLAKLRTLVLDAELAQAESLLAEAEANASEAQAQQERARTLQQQGFFSEAQLTQARTQYTAAMARVQSARATVELQRQRLAQATVRAPDQGLVSARLAKLGQVVAPGMELFRVIRQGRLEWRADVTAAELGQVKPGSPVQIQTTSGDTLQGTVRTVAPSVDPNTRNALVYVDIKRPLGNARPGMFARGAITVGQAQVITVPQSAVILRDGFSYVFTVNDDQRVSQRKVEVGSLQDSRIEIRSGLTLNAKVVGSGGAFLNDGDKVRVVGTDAD